MSYLVRPIKFESEMPEISTICTKCSDLSGVEICKDGRGIYVCAIPDEFIEITKEKEKIIPAWFYENSPFIVELVTNYLVSINGKISVEEKSLILPTTIDDIKKYNENIRKESKNVSPVIWGLIIIFVLIFVSVAGGIFFGLFKIFS